MAQTTLQDAVARTGVSNLLSKLKIGDVLYNIKDPKVEVLAQATDAEFDAIKNTITGIQGQIETLENHTWTAVTKATGAAKYATRVEQGTDGSITVVYDTVRAEALANTAETGKVVVGISQDVDGVVGATMGTVDAEYVTVSATGIDAANVKAALEALAAKDAELLGEVGQTGISNTIYGAKAYAKELVDELAGENWSENAATVQAIIDELSQDGNADLSTVVDKIRGDFTSSTGSVTTTDIKSYIDNKVAAAESAASGGITDLDAEVTSTDGTHVQVKVTEVDGIITGVSVIDHTPEAIATGVWAGIDALDTVVYGADGATGVVGDNAASTYAADTTSKVAIKLTEEDGKVISLDVKTNDVASHTDVVALATGIAEVASGVAALNTDNTSNVKTVNEVGVTDGTHNVQLYGAHIPVNSSISNRLDTYVTNLDAKKASAAAFAKDTVNHWTTEYTSNTETLAWSNIGKEFYKNSGTALTQTAQ